MSYNNALGELADSMAKAHEFAEYDFRMGLAEGETVFSLTRKKALATWQIYYNSAISPPLTVLNNLMLLLEQCETIDSDTLKVSKLHLVKRMASLKSDFDTHFERLLEKLNSLTGEILLKCLSENPKKD